MIENIDNKIKVILDLLDLNDLGNDEVKMEAIKGLVDIVYSTDLFIYKAQAIMELIKMVDKEGSDIIRDLLKMLEKTKKPIYPEDIRELQYTMMPPEYWLGDE
jgi:cyanate lyase